MSETEKILESLDCGVNCEDCIFECDSNEECKISTIEDILQEKQEREKGWIPVSRRLPNKEECEKYERKHPCYRKFLCTVKFNNGLDNFYQTRELYFSKIFGWKYEAEGYDEFVVAWQPLPEPYKEGENDE